jgi:protein-tyrosine kinase
VSRLYDALELARKKKIIRENPSEVPLPKIYGPLEGALDLEEEMISLYQNITGLLPDIARPIILFIGSQSNEGTSTVARQLSKVASLRLGKTVLLVDLDRSRPDFQVFVDAKTNDNLEDMSDEYPTEGKVYQQVEKTSLYVMPLFQQSIMDPRTLDSAKDNAFWEHLRDLFDLVIIDTPPATNFPDGLALVRQVDGVVLVFEAERTRWPVAIRVKKKILENGGKILGVVFNKRRFYIPLWLYKWL